MPRSVNYLYEKAKQSKETPVHPLYNSSSTADDFMEEIQFLKSKREQETGKELTLNNQIKHLIVAFHPSEKEIFDDIKDEILLQIFDELGLDPENHNLNAFIHNDQNHPHVHLIFSRNGYDKTVFDDKKIGERVGDIAQEISEKYNLQHSKNTSKIRFTSKELYKPTNRSLLKKCISYAMNEATSLHDFQKILKDHGVNTKLTNDGKIVYMTPKADVVDKERIPELIQFAKDNSKNFAEYKRILNNNGLYVKQDRETGKDIFSIQKVQTWTEDVMPAACRLKNLKTNIENNQHDANYINLREQLKTALVSCKTLEELKLMLPGADIKYRVQDNQIYNITIDHDGYLIRLEEVLDKDISLESGHSGTEYMKIPIIFTPHEFSDFEENRQKMLAKKYGKKHRQIGFKIQI